MDYNQINYIPIDFIKAKVIGLEANHFYDNPILKNPKSIFKGELLEKTIYRHKNLIIKIFEGCNRIEFSGSLHTFYNNGLHNYNDLSLRAFKTSLNNLYLDLGIKPDNLYILHLEWGYNLKPPLRTDYILDNLIQHKSVNKTVGIDCKVEGKYIQFKHSTKILKVYNKGKQFKLNQELIRIEIKQTNWSKYRLDGLVTLQDFIDTNKNHFVNELIHQWERVILYDILRRNKKHIKYQTLSFWVELRLHRSNKNFKYHFDKLNRLNQINGFNTKNKITELLIKKGNELQLKS